MNTELTYSQRYYAANKEYYKAYYKRNRDKILTYYREENKGPKRRSTTARRRYYQKNKELIKYTRVMGCTMAEARRAYNG